MTQGLADALRHQGHSVEVVTAPFRFLPVRDIVNTIDFWLEQDFNDFSGYRVDRVIVLQFPAYYAKHDKKVIWLMHQHRAVYDLFNDKDASPDFRELREKIHAADTEELSKAGTVFSMSKNVADRLKRYNGIDSIPVYHPPFGEYNFYCEEPYDYVFYPSRLEALKRQDLLIRAMKHTKTRVKAIIAGDGGQRPRYEKLIEELDVGDKVRLIGEVSEEEKYTLYARSLAVFFGPHDEDYGYVALEAMLSSKAVITCADSGGPLEFIVDGEEGFVVDPLPELIADKIDSLYHNRRQAKEMGKMGLEIYRKKNISWENVVNALIYS